MLQRGSLRNQRLAGMALIILATFGCSRSPEEQSARFIDAGRKLMQKNDAPRAVLQFQNAVKATPKNPEAYFLLGEAFLKRQDLSRAVASLKKALELDPKNKKARLTLARLMINGDEALVQRAQQVLEELLNEGPGDAATLHTLGLTELKLGKVEDAITHFGQASAAAPRSLMVAVNLSQAKLRQKDLKGAEETLKKAVAGSPKSTDALVVLGEFYNSQNRQDEARQEFQAALAMNTNHPAALADLAFLELRAGRKQEAEALFKRLSDLPSRPLKPLYAMFLMDEGRNEEAIREFGRLSRKDPEDRMARTRLISAYLSLKRADDAEKLLAMVLKKNPKDLDALLQRGEIFLMDKKLDLAETDLNQVIRMQPDSAEARYVFAKLQQARGAASRYRQELDRALQGDPYLFAIRLELVQALMASEGGGGAKYAMDVLEQTPELQKKSLDYTIQRNWVLWALQDYPEMRKGVDAGLAQQRSPDLLVQDGLWKLQAGNAAGARASLEEALKLDPSDLRALSGLREAYSAQKQPAMALQKVKEYAARQPRSPAVQEFLGMMLVGSGDRTQARTVFTAAKEAGPGYQLADLSLVQLDIAEGKVDAARERLKSMITADGSNTRARLWLGTIDAVRSKPGPALEEFRKVVAAEPRNAQALNNLAYLLVEHAHEPTEALKYAQKAAEIAPDNPEYGDTLGWILYQQGMYPAALRYLEKSAAVKGNPVWKYHLAMAYAKAGDLKRGQIALSAALKENPNLPEAQRAKELLSGSK